MAAQVAPQQIVRTMLSRVDNPRQVCYCYPQPGGSTPGLSSFVGTDRPFSYGKNKTLVEYFIKNNEDSLAANLDPRIISAAVTASIQAVINPTFILDNNLTFEEAGQQLIRFLLASFAITLE